MRLDFCCFFFVCAQIACCMMFESAWEWCSSCHVLICFVRMKNIRKFLPCMDEFCVELTLHFAWVTIFALGFWLWLFLNLKLWFDFQTYACWMLSMIFFIPFFFYSTCLFLRTAWSHGWGRCRWGRKVGLCVWGSKGCKGLIEYRCQERVNVFCGVQEKNASRAMSIQFYPLWRIWGSWFN